MERRSTCSARWGCRGRSIRHPSAAAESGICRDPAPLRRAERAVVNGFSHREHSRVLIDVLPAQRTARRVEDLRGSRARPWFAASNGKAATSAAAWSVSTVHRAFGKRQVTVVPRASIWGSNQAMRGHLVNAGAGMQTEAPVGRELSVDDRARCRLTGNAARARMLRSTLADYSGAHLSGRQSLAPCRPIPTATSSHATARDANPTNTGTSDSAAPMAITR